MKLKIVRIIAEALLLDFENISNMDIKLLAKSFLEKNPHYEFDSSSSVDILKYIRIENDKISLKDGLNLDSYIIEDKMKLRTKLQEIAGDIVINHFQDFDLNKFILKKIYCYSSIKSTKIKDMFCKKEQPKLIELVKNGYVKRSDIEIKLTDAGKLELALKDYLAEENDKSIMQDILSVWDVSHSIQICPFSNISNLILEGNKEVRINWDAINIEDKTSSENYASFYTSECNRAINYVNDYMFRESKVDYLVVVEKYNFNYEDNYLIRGIIKLDHNGFLVAFNPEYKKTIPQTIWEKTLRFSGYGVPDIYCLKREK